MDKITHKITAFVMAFVVLFSTTSYVINMHYCDDALVETSIMHKSNDCEMEMEKSSTEKCSIINKNCCFDKQLLIEGLNEGQYTLNNISFEQKLLIDSFVYTYINYFEGLEKKVSLYEEYKPPFLIKRIYKIDETYLI